EHLYQLFIGIRAPLFGCIRQLCHVISPSRFYSFSRFERYSSGFSREAAAECSPRRKPWVGSGPGISPGGAKDELRQILRTDSAKFHAPLRPSTFGPFAFPLDCRRMLEKARNAALRRYIQIFGKKSCGARVVGQEKRQHEHWGTRESRKESTSRNRPDSRIRGRSPKNPPPPDHDEHGLFRHQPGPQPHRGRSLRTRRRRQARRPRHVPRQRTRLRPPLQTPPPAPDAGT